MPTDYAEIAEQNRLDYGRKIGSYGPKLLARLYDKRTHFVFELLQNAEDALRRRVGDGPRSVQFDLRREGLQVSHFGKPFDGPDIKGVCGIDESTKEEDLTAIGRFGIGFKSVFAFTDRPEIRSGGESFAIESFVIPTSIPITPIQSGQTIFWFPFGDGQEESFAEIAQCLRDLGPRSLMFLREATEVSWSVDGGGCGTYARAEEPVSEGCRRLILREETEGLTSEETWLVFSSLVGHAGKDVGAVEAAFWVVPDEVGGDSVRAVDDSHLVAFFPTNVATRLGFLLQAPFRTTPARDNVPTKDEWNQHLAREAASLVASSLPRLRDMGLLSLGALSALPLSREHFAGTMLQPIFESVRQALLERPLLPTNGGLRVSAQRAVLARGQGLRDLLGPKHLQTALGGDQRLRWLDEGITLDRTPELRAYLTRELGVRELAPADFVARITKPFMEAQSDEWVRRLYGFLLGQRALTQGSARAKPWVRLEDGTHVAAFDGEQPNAFLPTKRGRSGFPTVRAEVCRGEQAGEFLKSLGLTEPDPVDDVVKNVLPRYENNAEPSLDSYEEDLAAIAAAYDTQMLDQRKKLVAALERCRWVLSRAHGEEASWCAASECYVPTERLVRLFDGVPSVWFVDRSVHNLQGEAMRDVLVACGASRYLETFETPCLLSADEREVLRRATRYDRYTGTYDLPDQDVRGLEPLLAQIGSMPFEEAAERAAILWRALADLVDRRPSVLKSTYAWYYHARREREYDASFVRRLKRARWIPLEENLTAPTEVVFEHIAPAWDPNVVLKDALGFKPPVIDMLAQELGLDREIVLAMANADPQRRALALALALLSEATQHEEPGNGPEGSRADPGNGSSGGELHVDFDLPTIRPFMPIEGVEPRGSSVGSAGGGGEHGTPAPRAGAGLRPFVS